jgi:hypothetical protein
VTLYCLSLSLSRIAKRVVELGQLPPREILSILRLYFLTIHTLAHGSILSNPLRIRSILSSARMREGVELCHSPPRRFSPPVVHNQESPLVSWVAVKPQPPDVVLPQLVVAVDSFNGPRARVLESVDGHEGCSSYEDGCGLTTCDWTRVRLNHGESSPRAYCIAKSCIAKS